VSPVATGGPAPGRSRRGRLLALLGLAALAVAIGVLLGRDDPGSPEDRRGATDAVARLAATVDERPGPSASALCDAVGPRTRSLLAGLGRYLPDPARSCRSLPRRVLRIALEPVAGSAGEDLEARVEGDAAVVRRGADGPEVSRATREAGGRWRADPGAGGVGAWRLETARRCSSALSAARLVPLSLDRTAYRRAIVTRLHGVADVLEMLEPARVPDGIGGAVAQPRAALADLRDGLRRGLQAVDGGHFSRDAPDTAQLPSLLQLLEAFPTLRDLGVPCLGGAAASPRTIEAGNAACEAVRPTIESAYRDAGRAEDRLGVGTAFDGLAVAWSSLSDRIAGIGLGSAPRLRPVRGEAVRSGRRAASLAGELAGAARDGGEDVAIAERLNLAQQTAQDALMALGFRWCGAIGA